MLILYTNTIELIIGGKIPTIFPESFRNIPTVSYLLQYILPTGNLVGRLIESESFRILTLLGISPDIFIIFAF